MTHHAYKILALLLVIVLIVLALVSCGKKNTPPEPSKPNSQITSPVEGTMSPEAADKIKDFLNVPGGEKTQDPPVNGMYCNGFVMFNTYTSFVFMDDKYIYSETKMGKVDESTSHQGTWEIKDGKLVLTVMDIDPDTFMPVIVEVKSYDYGMFEDGRLSINGKTFTLMGGDSDAETESGTDAEIGTETGN